MARFGAGYMYIARVSLILEFFIYLNGAACVFREMFFLSVRAKSSVLFEARQLRIQIYVYRSLYIVHSDIRTSCLL